MRLATRGDIYAWEFEKDGNEISTKSGLFSIRRVEVKRLQVVFLQCGSLDLEQTPIKLYHSRRRRSSLCIRQI
jgi:hypothetical protein